MEAEDCRARAAQAVVNVLVAAKKKALLLFPAVLLSGCVMIDSKASRVEPRDVKLSAFAGSYSPQASYRSRYWAGLQEHDRLEDYLRLGPVVPSTKLDSVRLTITPRRTLVVEGIRKGEVSVRRELVENTDFEFEKGLIVLRREYEAGGRDSPGFGAMTNSTRLQMDKDDNLVVVRGSAATGFATIFPVAMAAKGMAVFPRVSESAPAK